MSATATPVPNVCSTSDGVDCSLITTALNHLELNAIKIDPDLIRYVAYENELQMPLIMRVIEKELSEPYSIYTYRYFIHNWPELCFLVSAFLY